jgi:tRNA(Ile)-lysidine synthase
VTDLNARRVRFDADARLPLAVRPVAGRPHRVPGVGTRKLQDVFVDAKVPRERRGLLPVVADADGAVVWVPGLVRSGTARLTSTTTRVLELQFEAEDDDE